MAIPVLGVSGIRIKSLPKSANNTEGYVTELWIKNLRNNTVIGGGNSQLILEILDSTITVFNSRVSFEVKGIYYLEGNSVKTKIKVKGNRDIIDNLNNTIDKVATDISSEIIKNLHKDYGSGIVAQSNNATRRDNSYVVSQSSSDSTASNVLTLGDSTSSSTSPNYSEVPSSPSLDNALISLDKFTENTVRTVDSVQSAGSKLAYEAEDVKRQVNTEKKNWG